MSSILRALKKLENEGPRETASPDNTVGVDVRRTIKARVWKTYLLRNVSLTASVFILLFLVIWIVWQQPNPFNKIVSSNATGETAAGENKTGATPADMPPDIPNGGKGTVPANVRADSGGQSTAKEVVAASEKQAEALPVNASAESVGHPGAKEVIAVNEKQPGVLPANARPDPAVSPKVKGGGTVQEKQPGTSQAEYGGETKVKKSQDVNVKQPETFPASSAEQVIHRASAPSTPEVKGQETAMKEQAKGQTGTILAQKNFTAFQRSGQEAEEKGKKAAKALSPALDPNKKPLPVISDELTEEDLVLENTEVPDVPDKKEEKPLLVSPVKSQREKSGKAASQLIKPVRNEKQSRPSPVKKEAALPVKDSSAAGPIALVSPEKSAEKPPVSPVKEDSAYQNLPERQETETGLEVQALVWSPVPEERFTVINGNILKIDGMVDDVSVLHIGENYVVLQKKGTRWQQKMQVR